MERPIPIEFAGHELERICPACRGVKIVQHPAWADWWAANKDRPEAEQDPMPQGDSGRYLPEEIPCGDCDGRGLVLTEDGRDLLTFVRRYWGEP